MAEIEIISTTRVFATVSPGGSINKKKINLSSSDLSFLLVDPSKLGFLFPKSDSSSSQLNLNLINHLKTSLSRTLGFYYPLAGRLSTTYYDDSTISFSIDCNNAGVQFVHAVAKDVTISDLLQPLYVSPIFRSFFTLTKIKSYQGVTNPLLGVQITELSDGIFIGISINHAVLDGKTLWNFMNSWSEISRGLNQISQSPIFENWFRNRCIRIPISILNTSDEHTPPTLAETILHFSKEKVARLKEKANSEAGLGNGVISSLQALVAHLWLAVVRSHQFEVNEDSRLALPINLRGKLKPKIPEGYFGNAIQILIVKLKARDMMEKGIGFVALQLSNFVSGYTEEKAMNDIELWITDPKFIDRNNTVNISNSPRFDFYMNDFGWGKPIAIRNGRVNEFDGNISVFKGLEEGSLDIQVCLSPQILEALINDSELNLLAPRGRL